MNCAFWKRLMKETGFPEEAKAEVLRCGEFLRQNGQEEALDGAVEFFYCHDLDMKLVEPLLEDLSQESGVNLYTLWLLFLLEAAVPAKELYRQKGVPERVFWDTFVDLKYKVLECKAVQGVWGNFVSSWYPIFYSGDIVKLGRLEYEDIPYPWETPYEKHGLVVKKGDPVKNIHIPSSGEPFDLPARLDSYKRAYGFFREELQGGPLVCVCHSWLLYPQNRQVLSPSSNIVSFQEDFDLVGWEETETFGDAWRVFGAASRGPLENLPEGTSMQRGFKRWLLEGHKTGEGRGVLVFDGKTLLTR